MHGVSVRTVSLTRHSLSAKPFVAGAAAAEPPTGSGFAGGRISLNVQQKMCDFASKVGMKMCGVPDYSFEKM